MTKEEFNKIIDFAILREQEAVDFYVELQNHAKFKDQAQMMKDFENMERGHIIVLKNLKEKGKVFVDESKATSMKISNYVIADYDKDDLTYENIILIGIKREERAYKLYKDLANNFDDEDVKKAFNHLASQEIGHRNLFSDLYDKHVLKDN